MKILKYPAWHGVQSVNCWYSIKLTQCNFYKIVLHLLHQYKLLILLTVFLKTHVQITFCTFQYNSTPSYLIGSVCLHSSMWLYKVFALGYVTNEVEISGKYATNVFWNCVYGTGKKWKHQKQCMSTVSKITSYISQMTIIILPLCCSKILFGTSILNGPTNIQ